MADGEVGDACGMETDDFQKDINSEFGTDSCKLRVEELKEQLFYLGDEFREPLASARYSSDLASDKTASVTVVVAREDKEYSQVYGLVHRDGRWIMESGDFPVNSMLLLN